MTNIVFQDGPPRLRRLGWLFTNLLAATTITRVCLYWNSPVLGFVLGVISLGAFWYSLSVAHLNQLRKDGKGFERTTKQKIARAVMAVSGVMAVLGEVVLILSEGHALGHVAVFFGCFFIAGVLGYVVASFFVA